MVSGSSIPYRLRPNKAVDRELFLSLLVRLAPSLALHDYRYVGLGGPFLEDFRLIHSRVGISKMTCVESEKQTHKRQLFNRPVPSIECVHNTLEGFLDETDLDEPAIVWFDYTDPKEISSQVDRFSVAVGSVPVGSILRITLNANPSSLGNPDPAEIGVRLAGDEADAQAARKPTIAEWRLARLKDKLGELFPADLKPEGMTFKQYGLSLLKVLQIAVDKEALNHLDRKLIWALATHYADGQPMITAAVIVAPPDDSALAAVVESWEFFSTPSSPHQVDLPSLSTLERLTMESKSDAGTLMDFSLPRSDLGSDPFESFRKFYRIFPHFSRVEL